MPASPPACACLLVGGVVERHDDRGGIGIDHEQGREAEDGDFARATVGAEDEGADDRG